MLAIFGFFTLQPTAGQDGWKTYNVSDSYQWILIIIDCFFVVSYIWHTTKQVVWPFQFIQFSLNTLVFIFKQLWSKMAKPETAATQVMARFKSVLSVRRSLCEGVLRARWGALRARRGTFWVSSTARFEPFGALDALDASNASNGKQRLELRHLTLPRHAST